MLLYIMVSEDPQNLTFVKTFKVCICSVLPSLENLSIKNLSSKVKLIEVLVSASSCPLCSDSAVADS